MSKINSTFNAGYYFDKNLDLEAFVKEQDKIEKDKERAKRERLLRVAQRAGDDDKNAMDGIVIDGKRVHQTFAVPFHMQCLHCSQRIPKGTHVYMNRYKVQSDNAAEAKSKLGQVLWEIQFRCTNCSKHVYIRVDYDTPQETGGYVAHKHCKRFVGDFSDLIKKEIAKSKEDAIELAKQLATMSDAERRGLENRKRQEEDRRLEALRKRRNETTTEDLLARIAAEEVAGETAANTSDVAISDGLEKDVTFEGGCPDLDDADVFSIAFESDGEEDARSDSDAELGEQEGSSAVVGHKRAREDLPESHGESRKREEQTFSDASSDCFLSSINAVLGRSLGTGAQSVQHASLNAMCRPTVVNNAQEDENAAMTPPMDKPTVTDHNSADLLSGLTKTAPRKKAGGAKLKGKDFLSNYFQS